MCVSEFCQWLGSKVGGVGGSRGGGRYRKWVTGRASGPRRPLHQQHESRTEHDRGEGSAGFRTKGTKKAHKIPKPRHTHR